MKPAVILATCLLALAGCSSHYIISTVDGQLITADNKPRLDKENGMLRYEDTAGKAQYIPQTQVKQIIER